MIRVVALGYESLFVTLEAARKEIAEPLEIEILNDIFEDGALTAAKLEKEREVDVFLGGPGVADALRQRVRTPTVSFERSGVDLLQAFRQARTYDRRVAIFLYRQGLPWLNEVRSLLNIEVDEIIYESKAHAEQILRDLVRRGTYRVVVGGSFVCYMARSLGLMGLYMFSYDSILSALNHAVELVRARRDEASRRRRYEAIIDYAYSGIIATDPTGKVVVYNPRAEEVLGVPRSAVLDQDLKTALPQLDSWRPPDRNPLLNTVRDLNGRKVVSSSCPIPSGPGDGGLVVTFEDADTIEKAERKLRRSYSPKGFQTKYDFDSIQGTSPAIQQAKSRAERFARCDETVLIVGETGTGKELFAHAIHGASRRKEGPFIAVNCSALPVDLLESELFGYEEGAFTGARRGGKPGLFELAHGGTLFLDEIGELTPALQIKLLRVLQEREVFRVGGSQLIHADVRLICATNRDLQQAVREGQMREDFFFRISPLQLRIAPLRQRQDDLTELFWRLASERAEGDLEVLKAIWPELQLLLVGYHWPGNVRELLNLVQALIALGQTAADRKEASKEMLSHARETLGARMELAVGGAGKVSHLSSARSASATLKHQLQQAEREIIRAALQASGDRQEVAHRLGISPTTLWRKVTQLDLDR